MRVEWRHHVVSSRTGWAFVINGQMRQALDIPLWEKGQDDCVSDHPSPFENGNTL